MAPAQRINCLQRHGAEPTGFDGGQLGDGSMSELTIYVKADRLTCRNAVDTRSANQSGPMIVSVVSEYKPVSYACGAEKISHSVTSQMLKTTSQRFRWGTLRGI
jgi:hypothetical protein